MKHMTWFAVMIVAGLLTGASLASPGRIDTVTHGAAQTWSAIEGGAKAAQHYMQISTLPPRSAAAVRSARWLFSIAAVVASVALAVALRRGRFRRRRSSPRKWEGIAELLHDEHSIPIIARQTGVAQDAIRMIWLTEQPATARSNRGMWSRLRGTQRVVEE